MRPIKVYLTLLETAIVVVVVVVLLVVVLVVAYFVVVVVVVDIVVAILIFEVVHPDMRKDPVIPSLPEEIFQD